MKSKLLNSTIAILFLLIAILVLYFYFKTELPVIIYIALFGAAAGIIVTLLTGYFILPAGMFKYRFWFSGFLYGVYLALFFLLLDIAQGEVVSSGRYIKVLLFCAACGTIFIGLSRKWPYMKACKKTPLELHPDETEVLSDSAIFVNEDIRVEGRVILTSKRLCFIPLEKENPEQHWDLADFKAPPEVTFRFGVPAGIILHDKETKIYLKYAGLWEKEIRKRFPFPVNAKWE